LSFPPGAWQNPGFFSPAGLKAQFLRFRMPEDHDFWRAAHSTNKNKVMSSDRTFSPAFFQLKPSANQGNTP